MSECSVGKGFVQCKLGEAAENALIKMAEAMVGGWDSMMKEFLTSWLNVGLLVDLEAGSIQWLTAQLQVISIFLTVLGIMFAAIWTMIHYRGDKAIKLAQTMAKVVVVTTLGAAAVQVIIVGGDAFSTWILDSAGITTDARQIPLTIAAANPAIAILGGIFGIIATIIQWGIMLVRSAILPLLIGVWPVAAAASMIGGADQAFSKITNWIIAFALYKPVAAIIYAYAWKTKSGDDGIGGVINGLVLIALAVVALPAMMRLIAPGTSALGGASGGGMAMAGGAALLGAGVAAGAAVLSGGGTAAASAAGGAAKMAGGAGAASSAGSAAGAAGTAAGSSGTAGGAGAAGGGADPTGGGSGSGGTGGGGTGGSGAAGGSSDAASGALGGDAEGGDSGSGGSAGEAMGTEGADQGSEAGSAQGAGAASGAVGTDSDGGPTAPAGATGNTDSPAGADTSGTGTNETPSSESGTAGSAPGTSSPTGAPDAATPGAGSKNTSPKAGQAKNAAAQSMTQAVADGAKDADGKDVIGE
nr:putative membrane protein [Arthrobacter sp.]